MILYIKTKYGRSYWNVGRQMFGAVKFASELTENEIQNQICFAADAYPNQYIRVQDAKEKEQQSRVI